MGGGRLASVWASTCLPFCSDLPTGGKGTDCPLPALVSPSFATNVWPLLLPISVSISANFWPLLPLTLTGFLADPLPTPAPANVLFSGECGYCWITLCMSPCGMLPQEVLILGAILHNANRVVSAVAEDTVTVGIPSILYHSGWVRRGPQPLMDIPPCSALAKSTGLSRLGWLGLRMMPQVVGKAGSMYSRSTVSRVALSWGQSYIPWVFPLWDNLWAKALVYKMINWMKRESQVVGQRLEEGWQYLTQAVTRTVRGTDRCSGPPEVKVFPKVDPCSLEWVDEEVNVGLRDKVLLLSLDFHVARMSFFMAH